MRPPAALAHPLLCLNDTYLVQSTELLPSSHRHHACRRQPHDRHQLWAKLLTSGDSCESNASLLRFSTYHHAGWTAVLHGAAKALMYADRFGLSPLTPDAPMWVDASTCHNRSLTCLFAPLSACDGVARPGDEATRFARADNATLLRATSQAAQREAGSIPPRGWFWYTSALMSYLMRPSPALTQAYEEALVSSGLGAALRSGLPVVALHVRHGDSCGQSEAKRTARVCEPLAAYVSAIERLANATPMEVSTVFLATDDPAVVNATADYPQYTWLRLDGAADLVKRLNPTSRFLDNVIQANAMRASSIARNFQMAWSATLETMLLASCDLFVGKFTSSFFRLAYELHGAECDCAAPYISLDAPWCFDWFETVHVPGMRPRKC